MRLNKIWIALLGCCSIGCGGGSSGGSGLLSGRFIDSAVEGLAYEAGAQMGETDASGQFFYAPGATVTFTIGDIMLGQAVGAAVVTPVDLVPGAMDETNDTVTNLARFLQTIDADSNPANGITIAPATAMAAVGESVVFAQTIAAFEADANVLATLTNLGAPALIPAGTAQANLGMSLLGAHGGRYAGTYTGDSAGTWQLYLDRAGNLLGCGRDSFDLDVFLVSGTVTSDGSGVFGNVNTGASFTGSISNGAITGTWMNTMDFESGTFTGTNALPVDVTLDSAVLTQLAGIYTGTYTIAGSTNPATFTVGSNGAVAIAVAPSMAVGAIVSTNAGGAVLRGMTEEGTELVGNITLAGVASGSLSNPHFAEFGSFTATKP